METRLGGFTFIRRHGGKTGFLANTASLRQPSQWARDRLHRSAQDPPTLCLSSLVHPSCGLTPSVPCWIILENYKPWQLGWKKLSLPWTVTPGFHSDGLTWISNFSSSWQEVHTNLLNWMRWGAQPHASAMQSNGKMGSVPGKQKTLQIRSRNSAAAMKLPAGLCSGERHSTAHSARIQKRLNQWRCEDPEAAFQT